MTIFRISSLAGTLIHADTAKAYVARITLLSIEEQLVAWHVGLAVSNDMDIGSLNDAVSYIQNGLSSMSHTSPKGF